MQTLLKLVLGAGANPDSQQQRGYTALHEAAMHNSVERAQALLEAGADPAIKSDEGQTAADMAAQNGNTEVLEILRSYYTAALQADRLLRLGFVCHRRRSGRARMAVPISTAQNSKSTRATLACNTGSPSRIRTSPKAALAAQSAK